MNFKWEEIFSDGCHITYRAKVFNGWIILHLNSHNKNQSSSMVFVPDSENKWKI